MLKRVRSLLSAEGSVSGKVLEGLGKTECVWGWVLDVGESFQALTMVSGNATWNWNSISPSRMPRGSEY